MATKQSRRTYDPMFKHVCIMMVFEACMSTTEVARRIGVPRTTLNRWLWDDDGSPRDWPEGTKRLPHNVIPLFPDRN